MNILFYDMGSFTYKDLLANLAKMGHCCKPFMYHFPNIYDDAYFCDCLHKELCTNTYDIVFSVNFFPLVAKVCNNNHIRYVSWVYDSPLAEGLFPYFEYDTNYIFLFDRLEAEEYLQRGYTRIFHLPLAADTERISKQLGTPSSNTHYNCDVSFIGQLYTSTLDSLLYISPPYIKGYIEGILQAQRRIYGYDFIDELIPDTILDEINRSNTSVFPNATKLNRRGLVHAIHKDITNQERIFLLEELGVHFKTFCYMKDSYSFQSPIKLGGSVDYYSKMPVIFRESKLNLCPTLRSIRSGIPLRALDIMAAGGTLFSNYQTELAEHFEDGVDVIMYSSMDDAIEKAFFYLQNDSIRKQIALNGYQKVKESFNYPKQLTTLFETLASR